ncbi:Rv3235 family protein [uncultured Mycolicibacterium sp.]|uniref:Rv3235 family protein n=1 Tax=uncultured Mycolicibacterium sp. TaxID=2320817 RepID=UPI00261EEE90|nr:Rv3235 family protein [uncultured Mycolicibacterium sp.]
MPASQIPPARRIEIVDYEPPAVALSALPPVSLPAIRIPPQRPRALRAVAPPHREPVPPPAAARFADAALRQVLEVIDRRRPVTHLRAVLAPTVFDEVLTHLGTRPRGRPAAVLRRVRLRCPGHSGTAEPGAAEVFATYSRGGRIRVIAARVERVPGADRWQVVALQIG